MNLADIARQLSHGELSQVAFGRELTSAPTLERVSQLVDHVNLGLTSLYKRFNLKEGRELLTLVPTTLVYVLADPTLLKIEKVLTDLELEMPLNDGSELYGCFTPSAKKLRVADSVAKQLASLPDSYKTATLEVVFRANHVQLVAQPAFDDGLDSIELELPDAYLQALLYFVASRVHNPIGMVNEFNAGNNWFAKYEGECKRLEGENLEIDDVSASTRFYRGGWA